jgi:hypothetical protein
VLSQRAGGLRTSEIADALGASYSGAEKALDILVEDGLARRAGRAVLAANTFRARRAIDFALAFLPLEDAVAAIAAGSEAVEFAGVDEQGVLIVVRRFAEPTAEQRLREALDGLREAAPATRIEVVPKELLRETLADDRALRMRARRMKVLFGSVDRSFPDRSRHGDPAAKPLGRLNDEVRSPSQRRLRDFARAHGLRRIVAFGSAVRDDLRPDSDIDLFVEPKRGRRIGLLERVDVIADAERLFDRDVDLVAGPITRRALAERIDQDGVVLFDAAG